MITGTFTAAGVASGATSFKKKDIVSAVLSGEFTGSVVLELSSTPDAGGYVTAATITDTTAVSLVNEQEPVWYRLRCTTIGEAETITYSFGDKLEGVAVNRRGSDGNISEAQGKVVPADGVAGFTKGCLFMDVDGSGAGTYVNAGTSNACIFRPFGTWPDSSDGKAYSISSTNATAELVEV